MPSRPFRRLQKVGVALSSSGEGGNGNRVISLSALTPIDAVAAMPDEAVRRFQEEGAVMLKSVFSSSWVEVLREAAEANMADPGPLCDEHAAAQGTAGRFHDDQFLWMRHRACELYVTRSGVAALAARAMGSRSASHFYDQLLVKEPGTVAPTPWHNDTSYWHLSGSMICSVWLAMDDVPRETCVSYVRGSHLWSLRHSISSFSGGGESNYDYGDQAGLESVPDVEALVTAGEADLLNWDMEAGDVIVFNSYAVHGAKGNANKEGRRRGYATRWCGDDVTYARIPGTMDDGWKQAGFDCGLEDGAPITCPLHPNLAQPT